jgi:hypothetical protein
MSYGSKAQNYKGSMVYGSKAESRSVSGENVLEKVSFS